jgi:hypothetical protein
MSDLQTNLALLGAALIAGIFVVNRIQEYRYRRMANQLLPENSQDALMGETNDGLPHEPGLGANLSEHDGGAVTDDTLPPELAPVNKDIEFGVIFNAAEAVSAEALWKTLRTSALATRNIRWVGYDSTLDRWLPIHGPAVKRFNRLGATLQLTSRAGPVTPTQLTRFVDEMNSVAHQLGLTCEAGDTTAALVSADTLERFCARVDVLIGINVVFEEGASQTAHTIRAAAEAEGLTLADDGVFHARDAQGQDRYTLSNRDGSPFVDIENDATAVPGITLLLDVPAVTDGAEALRDLFELAGRLAAALGGNRVDDNGVVLGVRQMEVIAKQLAEIDSDMESYGIPAGSPLALRLFSH